MPVSYLFASDYNKQIQSDNLLQVIGGNKSVLASAELAAMAEMKSYLVQKYLIDSEFTDTSIYSNSQIYKAAARVYLDAPPYNQTATYAIGDLVLQASKVYKCTSTISAGEIFNIAHWSLLGPQYEVFYAVFPKPVFDYAAGFYNIGDFVFWKDRTYKALQQTKTLSHDALIQSFDAQPNLLTNIFPDDVINGVNNWSDQGAYTVPAGNILNTTYFTPGDNRNQQMITYLVDITLFRVHARIAPRNIPDLRVENYNSAIRWLKMASKGDVTADLVKIQPLQGRRIMGGSQAKQINSY